ncbi:hypothetical protein QA641_11260 [Bradyrhizobium sp. CB1650]|uniref:hypothetical protein n=1 Tax=Bradyrhizobium sp. CB1650 TaxID=3039153 RepID=UPI0024360B24|nr:hypothetical protein [Bradyrhizobium sp. CB1650]WGD54429.1 hypothetical protein QA641_11260 [Bradyrhizobium sp. CB1650]
MSTISSLASGSYQSPLQRLQQELQSEVSAGTISSSDQSALSTALNDIDTALQQSRASDESGGTRTSKDDMKSKIDDLISNEVSNGTLTSDQADELKGVFEAAFSKGPQGAGGPPPGPPPSDDGSSDQSSSSTDSTSSTSSDQAAAEILQQFLRALQQAQSSTSSYGASGAATNASSGSQFSALLIDYKS